MAAMGETATETSRREQRRTRREDMRERERERERKRERERGKTRKAKRVDGSSEEDERVCVCVWVCELQHRCAYAGGVRLSIERVTGWETGKRGTREDARWNGGTRWMDGWMDGRMDALPTPHP